MSSPTVCVLPSPNTLSSPHAHCGWCGTAFVPPSGWPRTCTTCHHTTYLNPLPIGVAVVLVENHVLAIRRASRIGRGLVALPGGHMEQGGTWQADIARELFEETGLDLDPRDAEIASLATADNGNLIVFARFPRIATFSWAGRCPDAEVLEALTVETGDGMAFATHTTATHMALDTPHIRMTYLATWGRDQTHDPRPWTPETFLRAPKVADLPEDLWCPQALQQHQYTRKTIAQMASIQFGLPPDTEVVVTPQVENGLLVGHTLHRADPI